MRGVNRPTARQHSPQDRSGDRSAGRGIRVVTRSAAVAAVMSAIAITTAGPAGAQAATGQATSGQSVTAVGVAQTDPMVLGLGPASLFWLLAGLLALIVGLVLATRGVRRPADSSGAAHLPTASSSDSTSGNTSTSHDRAGGAER